MDVNNHLNWLGKKVKDRVTEIEGVVVSVCFDLMGCVMADVKRPGLNSEGKINEGYWLDTNRLIDLDAERVMPIPNFEAPKNERWAQASEPKLRRAVSGPSDKSTSRL